MPAEILVRVEVTPTYAKGSIIAIKPEGWQWGTEELSDRFARVIVTDASPEELQHYVGDYRVGEGDNKQLLAKRLYYVETTQVDNLAALPGRVFTTNKATVDNFMRNLIDHG